MCTRERVAVRILAGALLSVALLMSSAAWPQARDPGVRHAATDGGPPVPLPGLTADELTWLELKRGPRPLPCEAVAPETTSTAKKRACPSLLSRPAVRRRLEPGEQSAVQRRQRAGGAQPHAVV